MYGSNDSSILLEIKPCRLGSRILDVEAFDTKQKPKVNHLVCASVWLLYFLYLKLKKQPRFFMRLEADVITQEICQNSLR